MGILLWVGEAEEIPLKVTRRTFKRLEVMRLPLMEHVKASGASDFLRI